MANNFTGGLNIRIPIFNSVQKAKAEEADADAMVARKQADLTRNQVGEDALKLQRSLRQLAAARDVAKLEWEVSQGELEAVTGRDWKTGTPIPAIKRMPGSTSTTSMPPTWTRNSNSAGPSCSSCGLPVNWRTGPFHPTNRPFAANQEMHLSLRISSVSPSTVQMVR